MRYWVMKGQNAVGPYSLFDLKKSADLKPNTLVAPEGSTSPDAWRPAKNHEDFRELFGKNLPPPLPSPPSQAHYMPKKSSGAAAILSFICPGLGQLYNGQFVKGFGFGLLYLVLLGWAWFAGIASTAASDRMLVLSGKLSWALTIYLVGLLIAGLPGIGLLILGIVNAYKTAEKINQGELQP